MSLITRRAFLRGGLATMAGGGGAYLYARTIEPEWLEIVKIELPLRGLPDAFGGFTIAQISDLHFGPLVEPAYVETVVQTVQDLGADAIVVTGDIVSRVNRGEPDLIVQTLSRLQAPEGVFAVLGNHDWWQNAPLVSESLRRAGITVLSNEHVALQSDGQTLYLAGVDDVWNGKDDFPASLNGIPADSAVITLVHVPDFADVVANDPRVILQLSGHTHGGQVRLPFYGGVYFPTWGRKYTMGLYQIRDLTLYTNRSIGMVGTPVRFICRPEATLFTLQPA
jgi:uncharacterized protein